MPPVDLSVLVVTYNSRPFVGDCIDAVGSAVRDHSHEIVVVDNGSRDGTVPFLRQRFPGICLVEAGRNLGFSAANNRALAVSSGRNVVLMNGDAVALPGSLDTLVRFLDERAGAGIVAPKLVNPDGSDQGTARSFPTPAAALFGRRSPLTRAFPRNPFSARYLSGRAHEGVGPFEVDWVSGACLMIRRACIERVGRLDETFFMYWEDADLCRRVKQSGSGVWCVPDSRVVHAEGGSRCGWPPAQVRHFHRSAYRYYAKHHLNGRRRPLRPVAATALAGRAVFVMAREAVRPNGHTGSMPDDTPALPQRGAIELRERS